MGQRGKGTMQPWDNGTIGQYDNGTIGQWDNWTMQQLDDERIIYWDYGTIER